MKKTFKCAVAAMSAFAVITASSLSASAASCFEIFSSPNNCNSISNTCSVSIFGNCPSFSSLSSLLKALLSGNLFGNNNGCADNNDCNVTAPGGETGTDNSCDTGDCTTEPDAPSVPDIPAQDNTASKPSTSADSVSEYEKKVVELVNAERAKYGLSALTLNAELSAVARAKSQDMKDKNYFSHTSPTYGSPFEMMKSFGIKYKTAGENIAYGYRTPEAVVNGWMNSEGHRANILNSSYKEIGVGYVASGNYWTQMFIG